MTFNVKYGRLFKRVLEKFEMSNCKPVSYTMESQINIEIVMDKPMNVTMSKQTNRSQIHVVIGTRLDICFVFGRLSQYIEITTQSL